MIRRSVKALVRATGIDGEDLAAVFVWTLIAALAGGLIIWAALVVGLAVRIIEGVS